MASQDCTPAGDLAGTNPRSSQMLFQWTLQQSRDGTKEENAAGAVSLCFNVGVILGSHLEASKHVACPQFPRTLPGPLSTVRVHGERHCQLYHDDVCNLATFQLSEPKIQDYSGYFILEIIVLLGQ